MPSNAKRAIALVTALAVATTSVAPALAQSPSITRSEYEACHTQDETAFRAAIQKITLDALRHGTRNIDYEALVKDQWRKHKLEGIVDKRVDLAADEVRRETSWGQLLKSLAYRDKAKELATAVAERVYRSDAMKAALNTMAIGVGHEIGKSIELTTADAALPAQRCLKAFLGGRYGNTVARAVVDDTGAAFKLDPNQNAANISSGTVVRSASGGIAGAVILLVRRQLARMAQRLGQRIVGSVLGRLVAVVAGGVGVVLIAKDVWDLRNGVLPIIATEMKSEATKAKVREELANAIRTQVAEQLGTLAEHTSERIVDIWRDFKSAHSKVLDLAARNASFKQFLDSAQPDQLPRIDEIVALVLKQHGEPGLSSRLRSGTLQRAVNRLSGDGMQIARELQSVDRALTWSGIASPDQLKAVIAHELHRRAKPSQFSSASLSRLLSLSDELVIVRLAGVKRETRDVLFDLGDQRLAALTRGMDVRELETLSDYITGLSSGARHTVLTTVAETPTRMRVLASNRVRDAILSSADQDAAVAMMLRQDKGFNLATLHADMQLALARRVNPVLVWEKHPIAIVAVFVLFVFILLLVRRILFAPPRRPPPPPRENTAMTGS